MAEFTERMELLRKVRLFAGLGEGDLEGINDLLVEKRYRKGSVVFEQGDDGDAMFIVEGGRAKVSVKDEQGREKILSVFGTGDYFGEMALLSDEPRSATVTIVGDSEMLVLPKEAFERFLATNLGVMRQFVNLMSRRLSETSQSVASHMEQDDEQLVLGKCIAAFSPKGGIGKTTFVVNLAIILQEETGKPVVILDYAYPFGDVGVMLNIEPRRTIVDLLPHINEMSGEIIESILQTHASGVKVLLAPPTPEETELVTAEHISIIISTLREQYEYIIVDTHSSFTEVSIAALDAADLVLLLTTLELPSLKSVRQFMDTATQKLGYPPEKMALVVNRVGPVGGLSLTDVEASVGAKVVATVGSYGPVAVAAANQGVPVALSSKESGMYRDLLALAKLIAPQAMVAGEDRFADVDLEEESTLAEKIKVAPRQVIASAQEGIAAIRLADIIFGLGSLFGVSAPFMLVFALLGLISKGLDVRFPANPAFNIAVWIGILGGAYLVNRLQEPRRNAWVFGGVLGGTYGLAISFASLAVLNIADGTLNTPIFGILFNIIPYALLGIIGTLLSERTRPQAQSLLRV